MIQVRIQSVQPQISIHKTPGRLELQAAHSRISMESEPAQLRIENSRVELSIDQSQCFADKGLRGLSSFLADCVQRGRQAALECAGRYASEGTELAAIEKGGRIENVVGRTMDEDFGFAMDTVPKQRPEVSWNVTGTSISHQPRESHTSASPPDLQISYQESQLKISLERAGSVEIDFVGGIFDASA